MKQFFKSLSLSILATLFAVSAYAQVTTSSLGGRVADSNGEPLVGAVVTAVHTPSGTQYYGIVNGEGQYHINGMRAGGPYTVDFSFLGMGTVEYNDIILRLGETYILDGKLSEDNQLEGVTIVAEKSFNASITGAGSAFNQRQVENMPSIDRSVYDVVKFTPQANLNKNGGISFSGSNNRYNSFQIDGAVANDSFGLTSSGTNGGQTGANPISIDAIEEIQVVIAPFDVRQSGFTGGAINAITKSGTNEIKGSFYTHYFNQDLVGTTAGPLSGPMAIAPADGKRHKYDEELALTAGFTVGAPIIKNKLFIFLSGEYYKKEYPNVYYPGNYAARPFSSPITYGGVNLGTEFNDEMAAAILDHYEKTYAPKEGYSESYGQHMTKDRSINLLARVDWNINKNNKFMFRYQYADAYADKYGSGYKTYYFNNSSYLQVNKTNTLVAELNTRVNDHMSNELRATAVFVRDHREPPYQGATMYIKDPAIYFDLGTEYSSGANSMASDTYTLTDNFSIFAGNHNITIGTHNEMFKFNNVFIQYANGEYTFAKLQDFFDNKYSQYDYKFVDPVYTKGDPNWAATTYALELGAYVQDEWKPNRNFTLTYGFRVDVPMLLNKPTENPVFNASSFATVNNEYVGTIPKKQPLFSPRVGFRYYIDEAHKSLLRGGAGLFTGRVPFVWLSNAYNNTGMETKSVTSKVAGLPLTSNPYKDIIETGILDGSTSGSTINTLNENFKYPQVFRANIGFDQEFEGGWKLTFDGIFSKTLNNVFFHNLAISSKNKVYAVSKEAANDENTAPYYKLDKGDYSAIVALGNTNKGYTYSLSGQVQKHFNFGLDLSASYTFGHAYSVNDGTSSVAYSNWKYNNSRDTNSGDELSYSLFDKPHKVTAVAMYTTPMYGGRFKTSVSLTYQTGSGQRFSYTIKESGLDYNGDGQEGNSLLYIPTKAEIAQMNWTNASSAVKFEQFIRNDAYLNSHRGKWSERYAGIAPWEHHFDFQVTEDFYYDVKKGRKLQLFANLINASNLFNREWGLYYGGTSSRTILQLNGLVEDAAGDATPTYSYYDDNDLSYSDFYSRWRCQIGLRVTF